MINKKPQTKIIKQKSSGPETEEEWKPIKDYEGLYEVSSRGRIRSIARCTKYPTGKIWHFKGKILSPISNRKDWRGYDRIRLYKNGLWTVFFIHRLVAQAFIPNPDNKREVNHKDGNRHNNSLENLEWSTPSENILHRIYALNKGQNNNMEIVPVRCVETGQGFRSISEAARWYKCLPTAIWSSIKDGRVARGYHFRKLYRQPLESWVSNLEREIASGYIRVAKHPSLPLKIYNYTKKCQFEGKWNNITTWTRGLILDNKNNIIVDPPKKFFNDDEIFASKINLAKALILEKADGFMIIIKKDILYGLIVSSRGSFDNKYVEAAKNFITPGIEKNLIEGLSYFCELCQNFPGDESTIVARHPEPKLVCWAIRDEDGKEYDPEILSPFPTVKKIPHAEMTSYLKQQVEGVVIFNPKTGERVKKKTSWWFEQHKLISGFSKKYIWEILKSGRLVSEVIETDELLPQAMKWAKEIKADYESLWQRVQEADSETSHLTDKELGLLDKYQPIKKYLFLLRKDQDQAVLNKIWDEVKPSYDTID